MFSIYVENMWLPEGLWIAHLHEVLCGELNSQALN